MAKETKKKPPSFPSRQGLTWGRKNKSQLYLQKSGQKEEHNSEVTLPIDNLTSRSEPEERIRADTMTQLTSRKWGEVLIGSLDWHVHCFEPNRGHYFVPLPLPSFMLLAKKIQSRSLSLHSPTKQPNFWALKSFMFMWHFVYDNHETFRYTITPMSKIESNGSHHVPANFYVTY